MTKKADQSRLHRPYPEELDSLGQDLQVAKSRHVDQRSGDDLARILAKLISDVERFDSMVVIQRKKIEQRASPLGAVDDDQLGRQSERMSLEAAEMVTCARHALEQLRRLGSHPTEAGLAGCPRIGAPTDQP